MNLSDTQNAAVAGAAAGIAGLLVFLGIHHLTIRPIWFIAPIGIVFAAGGGALVGWAYALLLPNLPKGVVWSALSLAALLTLTQLPGFLIGQTREPIFDMATANILLGKGWDAARRFAFDLFLTAGLTGALLGWGIGRSPRAALAMAAAGLAFSIGPGHNIPFFAGTSGAAKMWAIMLAVILASALTLAGAYAWLNHE